MKQWYREHLKSQGIVFRSYAEEQAWVAEHREEFSRREQQMRYDLLQQQSREADMAQYRNRLFDGGSADIARQRNREFAPQVAASQAAKEARRERGPRPQQAARPEGAQPSCAGEEETGMGAAFARAMQKKGAK